MTNVIKALEHCKDNQYVNDCNECDYGGKTGMFCIRMINDVIALLKEQEEKMKHLNNITLEYEKEVFRLQTLLKEQEKVKVVFGRCKDGSFATECGHCGTYLDKAYSICPKCNKELDWNSNQN